MRSVKSFSGRDPDCSAACPSAAEIAFRLEVRACPLTLDGFVLFQILKFHVSVGFDGDTFLMLGSGSSKEGHSTDSNVVLCLLTLRNIS